MNPIIQYSPVLVIAIPIIAALFAHLFPKKIRGVYAFLVGLVTLGMASLLFLYPEKTFVIQWIKEPIQMNFALLTDGLGVSAAFFAALLGMIALLYSVSYMTDENKTKYKYTKWFYTLMLLAYGTSIGALLSANLILFVIFWKLVGAALYGLVNMGHGTIGTGRGSALEPYLEKRDSIFAAFKSFMYLTAADYAMIIGIILLFVVTGSFSIPEIATKLHAMGAPLTAGITAVVAIILFSIGPLCKGAGMPLHSWMPDMAGVSPTPVVGMLPAALEKILGIALLARIWYYIYMLNPTQALFPAETLSWQVAICIIATITMAAAGFMAMIQDDTKRLLAYHAISQLGYMLLGLGIGSPLAIAGGLFHMINNATYKMGLFLSAGAVQYRTGIRDMDRLGGIAKHMPVTVVCFTIAAMSISGFPPFNGFASKWMIYQAGVMAGGSFVIWVAIAMMISALTVAHTYIKLIHSMFYGRKPEHLKKIEIKEVPFAMKSAMISLSAICVLFGVVPQLPLNYLIIPALSAMGIQLSLADVPYLGFVGGIGAWGPTWATAMLLGGVLIGYLTFRLSKVGVRTGEPVTTYACGEDVPSEEISVTTHHFFTGIINALQGPFNIGRKGEVDIFFYGVGNAVVRFTQLFRKTHTGTLTTYISWLIIFIGIGCFLALGGI